MPRCQSCGDEITQQELEDGWHHLGESPCGFRWSPTQPAPQPDASAKTFGWRLTLPNHMAMTLGDGLFTLGRATAGLPGQVLELFSQVSREHLNLEVLPDTLRVWALADKNPSFAYPASEASSPDDQLHPTLLQPGDPVVLRAGGTDSLVVQLAQCCFIKIDRGEA